LPQGECHSDMSRLAESWLTEPETLVFADNFLRVRLMPPVMPRVACRVLGKPLTIDGQLSDWPEMPELQAVPPAQVTWELVPRQVSKYAAAMRVAHDATYLYFACRVTAPSVTEGKSFPEIVELFLDGRADRTRSGNVWQRTKGLTQFAIHRDFSETASATHATVSANGDPSQAVGVLSAAARTPTGYTLEVAIPLANFTQIQLKEGSEMPWHWAVSFSDQTVNLDWLGLMSRTQSTRGYATLVLE
jgi:hypothetical protein